MVLFVFALAAFCLFFIFKTNIDFSDFEVFYQAGAKALRHATVYDVQGHYQFKCSPFVALAYGLSFSWMTYGVAAWLHFTITIGLWSLWIRRALRQFIAPKHIWLASTFIIAIFFNAFLSEFKLGQSNAFAVVFLGLAFVSLKRSPLQAGVALSLAIQVKLYCAFAIPYLLFSRRFSVLGWALAATVGTALGVVGVYSGFGFAWNELALWAKTLSASSTELLLSNPNVSFLGAAGRIVGLTFAYWIWVLGIMAFIFRSFVLVKKSEFHALAEILTWTPILNPLAWPYWISFSIPAFCIGISKDFTKRWVWIWILGLASMAAYSSHPDRSGTLPFVFLVLVLLSVHRASR